MPVLNFRSPQQKLIPNAIYKGWLNHYGYSGQEAGRTLLFDRESKQQPYIFQLDAPTGFGKTVIAMEPVIWLTEAISRQDKLADRWTPLQPKDLEEYCGELLEGKEFVQQVKNLVKFGINATDHEGFAARNGLIGFQGEPQGQLPVPVSDGATAVYVRTRSQTQAFLREAKRKDLRAIALPSKASTCRNRSVQRPDSDFMNAVEISLPDDKKYDQQYLRSLLEVNPSEVDFTNPTSDQTPYNPGQHKFAARFHSYACDKCSQCPLNPNYQAKLAKRPDLEGIPAEEWAIVKLFNDDFDTEKYMDLVVEKQQYHMDLEESSKALWQANPYVCPYPVIRNSLGEFDFIIMTYPYLFNPQVRAAMADHLDHVRHILIDEAHNISQLYGQLTTNVYPGASLAFTALGKSFLEFSMIPETFLEKVKAELEKGLFNTSMYDVKLTEKTAVLSGRYPEMSNERLRKLAIRDLEDDGEPDPMEIFRIYEHAQGHMNVLAVWVALVEHRYIEWYSKLVEQHGEDAVSVGFEPDPMAVMDFTFGPHLPRKLVGEEEEDGSQNPLFGMANGNMGLLSVVTNINVVLSAIAQLETVIAKDRLTILGKSSNKQIKAAAWMMGKSIQGMVDFCHRFIAIAQSLVCVYPEPMNNWFRAKELDARLLDLVFIQRNPYIFETESASNYYLNGYINYGQLIKILHRQHWWMQNENQFDNNPFRLGIDEINEDGDEAREGRTVPASLDRYFTNGLTEGVSGGDLLELIREVEDAYSNGLMTQDLVNRVHAMGVTYFPQYAYKGEFPYTDWKVYYRYMDGRFEIIPLTLGRLLNAQFKDFDTIGLISGTFPPEKYIQAFWGLNPYSFKVTEKVGKIEYVQVNGVSSQYDQRERSYAKWASLISQVHKSSDKSKSTLAVFPSKAVLIAVAQYLENYMSMDDFWPTRVDLENGDVDVNDMIEQLNLANTENRNMVFLATMGSRLTEGVEYVDSDGNSMLGQGIICGIQYSPQDIHLTNMQAHAQATFPEMSNFDAFELLQTEQAYQKVRQAVGRLVRSNNDSAVVYLADNRYSKPFWQTRMPCTRTISV